MFFDNHNFKSNLYKCVLMCNQSLFGLVAVGLFASH